MKKALWTLAGLVLAGMIGLAAICLVQRDLVALDDGRLVVAEAVWILDEDLFCQIAGAIEVYPLRRVSSIAEGMPTDAEEMRLRFLYVQGRLDAAMGRIDPRLLGIALLVAGFWAIWRLGRAWRRRGRLASADKAVLQSDDAEGFGLRLAAFPDVEAHFLGLYRAQLGADPRAEAGIEVLSQGAGSARQYRLKVFHNGQWRQRHMTISPLGAGTSSKSQCFYVIFDTHLVVKIPPVPIKDFSDYLKRLRKEARIAARIEGRPCIIPNLAAILSRVEGFGALPETDPQQLEARYLKWLEADPDRQRHLKIAGAFAFFMDLSRHQFLGHVLAQLEDGAARLAEVVAEDIALIDDCQEFEHKYGAEREPLCFALQDLYAVFTKRLRSGLADGYDALVVTEEEKKGWLLGRMAGVPAGCGTRVPASAAALVDTLLGEVLADRREAVEGYRRMAVAEGQRRTFVQARARMEALATNVLALLSWLGDHQVAMRDLKPDNLLVAGDSARDPHFLAEAERFVIGLIDMETAAAYASAPGAPGAQPQLGGTPCYATPSHFFPNTVLTGLYEDLGRVLHFQDWYAVVGIVFEIVAGSRLFVRTGQLFSGWFPKIRQSLGGLPEAQQIYRTFSRQFWETARTEFTSRSAAFAPRLAAVTVEVPGKIQALLAAHVQDRHASLTHQIEACIATQDLIHDAQRRKELAQISPPALENLMARYQGQTAPAARGLVALLRELATLKNARIESSSLYDVLSRPGARVQVKALLPVMFDMVAAAMQPASGSAAEAPRALTLEDYLEPVDDETLGYTHTIAL